MMTTPTTIISPALARLDSFCANPRQTEEGDLIYTQPIHAWTSLNGPGSDQDSRLKLTDFRAGELATTVKSLFDANSDKLDVYADGGRAYRWQQTDVDGTFRETGLFLDPQSRTRVFQRTNHVRYEMRTAGDAIYLGGLMFITKPEDLCHFYKNPYRQGGFGFISVLESLMDLFAETCGVKRSDISIERLHENLTVLKTSNARFLCAEKIKTGAGDAYKIEVGALETFQPEQALNLPGLTREFADYLRLRQIKERAA